MAHVYVVARAKQCMGAVTVHGFIAVGTARLSSHEGQKQVARHHNAMELAVHCGKRIVGWRRRDPGFRSFVRDCLIILSLGLAFLYVLLYFLLVSL